MYYKIVTNTGIVVRCKNIPHCRMIIDFFGLTDFQISKVYPECKGHKYFEYGLPTTETKPFDRYLISKGCSVLSASCNRIDERG